MVGVCATPKTLISEVSKGRPSAPDVIQPAGSPEKNHRTCSSKWKSASVDNGVGVMEDEGSTPSMSAGK